MAETPKNTNIPTHATPPRPSSSPPASTSVTGPGKATAPRRILALPLSEEIPGYASVPDEPPIPLKKAAPPIALLAELAKTPFTGGEQVIDMSRVPGTKEPEKLKLSMGQVAQGKWNHYELGDRSVAELDVTRTSLRERAALKEALTARGFTPIETRSVDQREYVTLGDDDAKILKKLQTDIYRTRVPDIMDLLEQEGPTAPTSIAPQPSRPLTANQRLFAHGEWHSQKGPDGTRNAHLDTSSMQPHEIVFVKNALRRSKIEFSADPQQSTLRLSGQDAELVMDLQKLHNSSRPTAFHQPLPVSQSAERVNEASEAHHSSPSPHVNPQLFSHGQWTAGQSKAGTPTATLNVEALPPHEKSRMLNSLRREDMRTALDAPGLKATTVTVEGAAAQKLLEAQAHQQPAKAPPSVTTAAVAAEPARSKTVKPAARKVVVVAATVAANESRWGVVAKGATRILNAAKRIPGIGIVASLVAGTMALGMYLSRGEVAKADVETVARTAEAGANRLESEKSAGWVAPARVFSGVAPIPGGTNAQLTVTRTPTASARPVLGD